MRRRRSGPLQGGKGRGEKSRSKDRPLQLPAGGAFGLGAPVLADFGGAGFVGGGVAGALEGAPHVPTGDGAVGAPAFAEGEELLGLGHVFLAVGYGPAFFYARGVGGGGGGGGVGGGGGEENIYLSQCV